ncbi:hypothetical protein DFR70_12598 [Nocardia tenerifensis]|uniref:Competence protein CoiA-like protein n=1 Tax=Nocardia tenerifensis TaxID=228006 RepID=A0A318JTJ9_9NOCA|nr:hypothetical protein [Nocardia tenerifensis]PXX54117.1 hypothetical protein DFR70_12598 [Nocardia tenerifensis]
MRTKQRAEIACGRKAMLAELGIADGAGRARGRSGGYGCKCPECDAAQWDMRRLKYWVCGRLLAYGADVAEVDRRVDGLPVDIYWRKGDREFVIEVRSGALERALAQEHTDRLRAAGIEDVLWLCPPGYWVDHLHALGIADFAPPACDCQAVTGVLDTAHSAVASPRRHPLELRDFIRGWVNDEIVWGYRDVTTGGWATVADWEHHTKTQALIIARQRQELVNQRTTLALSRKTVRDKQKHLMKLTARLERAEQEAQERADALAQARRKIDDHHRVDTSLRNTIKHLQQTINHWQLVTCCAMMLIVTFLAGAMVVR